MQRSLAFSLVSVGEDAPADTRINEIIEWGKKIHRMGAVQTIEGNLSFRTTLGFVITATGSSLGNLTENDMVEIRGIAFGYHRPSVCYKGKQSPSMETLLHSGLYELLPEVNAIFHAHDKTVLKAAEKLGIPVTDAEYPEGSQELAQAASGLVKIHKDARYFILKNHGIIAIGETISGAGELLENMHKKSISDKKEKTHK